MNAREEILKAIADLADRLLQIEKKLPDPKPENPDNWLEVDVPDEPVLLSSKRALVAHLRRRVGELQSSTPTLRPWLVAQKLAKEVGRPVSTIYNLLRHYRMIPRRTRPQPISDSERTGFLAMYYDLSKRYPDLTTHRLSQLISKQVSRSPTAIYEYLRQMGAPKVSA